MASNPFEKNPESILQEAQRLINGPRNKNYGHPRDNFANIAALYSGYLGQEITDIDVANLMILMKVARVKGSGYHRDSFTDIAGYAGCVERIYEGAEVEDPEPVDLDKEMPAADWGRERVAAYGIVPRVWNSIIEVESLAVVDKNGEWWSAEEIEDAQNNFDADDRYADIFAPFTEVVRLPHSSAT